MEILVLNRNTKILISSLCVAVILILAIVSGLNSGKNLAQSEVVFKNAESIYKGLGYFYNDQDRYPNAVEFADTSVMLNYFSSFPALVFKGSNCTESYVYKRVDSKNFTLDFCLVGDYNNNGKGWNRLTGNE